ncbi:hypothetical protein J3R82DRAFT_3664 [Butyriboletus roseoflavus]|nr:hypothetical protein J3R82DRAFT_3664 [Butyriboletus roseoflavus]
MRTASACAGLILPSPSATSLSSMADISSQIESAPIPSIQSLKSRFEQFALDNASPASSAHLKPTPVSPALVPPQSQNIAAPESVPTPRARMRVSLIPENCISQSQPVAPVCNVRGKVSVPDLKATGIKRAPPPPPLPRTKKPPSSPVASPLLRPVPVPAALRSPRTSPEREPLTVRPDHKSREAEESSEDGSLGSVASLRNRFSSPTPIPTSRSSPPRPTTPRPPSRPPTMTSSSDSVVLEHAPPVIPSRHTKPPPVLSQSPSEDISSGIVTMIASRFASKDVSKLHPHDDNLSSLSEPNILITSPPTLPVRHPPPRPLNSVLFAREDSLDPPSSCSSSLYSPFSDDESEISEVSSTPSVQPRKAGGSCEFAHANGVYSINHERKLSGSSSESLSSLPPLSKPRPPPRPAPHALPRPPHRPHSSSAPSGPHEPSLTSSVTTTPTQSIAPPLPSRRVMQESTHEVLPAAPPLPARVLPPQSTSVEITSPVAERKSLGNARLPPPPTRTIGLGDKLPPMRRAHSPSSDEESGSEEDPRARSAESLPDSSRSSRRPPTYAQRWFHGIQNARAGAFGTRRCCWVQCSGGLKPSHQIL